ncbi:MAG: orotidine 5'-phosphate decarboxylase [Phycisphaerae bacterium]|nr:orotidine 5'-phosphate decarboxylase [Phycisphaerae bacterium]
MATRPVVQVALDFLNLEQALRVAREAVAGGVDWLEAGTPLIKAEGLDAVRRLRAEFPDKTIVADMKVMDAGRTEVEAAAKAGANIVDVLGQATDETIAECIEAGANYGARIAVDLIAVPNPVERARQLAKLGPHVIAVHTGIDEQMHGKVSFHVLAEIAKSVDVILAIAGGINSQTCVEAVRNGAGIVIVGGAITKSPDARKATEEIRQAIASGQAIVSELFRRVGEDALREVFERVSTADISAAMHNAREIEGVRPIKEGLRVAGPAFTVRTAAGDWAKPVEAIDHAQPGDVIVIDAGGKPPAIWGELATHSCQTKQIAGVVIDGAIRDTFQIKRMGFPAFARYIVPAAGDPKGLGEMDAPIIVGNCRVRPGDWIVGDDDGVIVIPKADAVEIANRAQDVLERENRIRAEIDAGSTLAAVVELDKWEKRS